MNRRGFLTNAAKVGTGSLVNACVPGVALAEVTEAERQRLWYASHCSGCGFPYCPKWLARQDPQPKHLVCEWCKWHKPAWEAMEAPAEWYPGMYEDPNAKVYL